MPVDPRNFEAAVPHLRDPARLADLGRRIATLEGRNGIGTAAIGDPLTVPGRIAFGATGVVWEDTVTLDTAGAGVSLTRFRTDITTAGGVNARSSGAADAITSPNDPSNVAGSSFYLGGFWSMTHRTPGSAQVFTAVGVISDSLDGGTPRYRELGLIELSLTADSAGAYSAFSEGILVATAGKPARSNAHVVIMDDANPLTAYAAAFGVTSIYKDTGARAYTAENVGPQPGGTAYHVYGDWARGLLCTFFNQADFMVESRPQGAPYPLFAINGLGTIAWGASTAVPDLNLYRGGAGVLRTDQAFSVGTTLDTGGAATINGALNVVGTTDLQGAVNLGSTLGVAGGALVVGDLTLASSLAHTGVLVGFYGATPTSRPSRPVTLPDVIAVLVNVGLTA